MKCTTFSEEINKNYIYIFNVSNVILFLLDFLSSIVLKLDINNIYIDI